MSVRACTHAHTHSHSFIAEATVEYKNYSAKELEGWPQYLLLHSHIKCPSSPTTCKIGMRPPPWPPLRAAVKIEQWETALQTIKYATRHPTMRLKGFSERRKSGLFSKRHQEA